MKRDDWLVKLSRKDRAHLLGLLLEIEREGSYYGNPKHYYARTKILIRRLTEGDR